MGPAGAAGEPPRLRRGDHLPRLVTPVPGPRSRALSARLRVTEAAGIDTLAGGAHPVHWREARGANVLDVDGNRYVDLTSGFGAALLGHRPPAVVAAVRRQAARLLHGLGDLHAHPARIALGERLAELAPWPRARVYFAVSGADAVEIALKTAHIVTGHPGVLAFEGAYHGLSLGALSVTGRERFRAPFAARLAPTVSFLPYGAPLGQVAARLAAAHPCVGAVIVEPIQGRAGIRLPPPGWLAELATVARDHGALLVADEILTGGGRTGAFFAVSDQGCEPDLICCGKALGGGMPLAAVLGRGDLLAAWPDDGEALHTATFLAHPPACAAALAALDELTSRPARQAWDRLSGQLTAALEPFASLPGVREVRGRGLLWGVELAAPGAAVAWSARAQSRGILALPAGDQGEVLELLPPLCLSHRQLEDAVGRLRHTLPPAAR